MHSLHTPLCLVRLCLGVITAVNTMLHPPHAFIHHTNPFQHTPTPIIPTPAQTPTHPIPPPCPPQGLHHQVHYPGDDGQLPTAPPRPRIPQPRPANARAARASRGATSRSERPAPHHPHLQFPHAFHVRQEALVALSLW